MHTIFASRAEFLQFGKASLPEPDYADILDEVRDINLGAEVIIAGFHGDDPVIVRLDMLGEVHWEDTYSVVGTGSDIALAFLCQNEYDTGMPLSECLFRVFEAKAAAQKNRTVGTMTSFQILIRGRGRFDVSHEYFNYLKTKRRMVKVPKIETQEGWLEALDREGNPIAEDADESEHPSPIVTVDEENRQHGEARSTSVIRTLKGSAGSYHCNWQ